MSKLTLVSLSYNHCAFAEQAIESFINQKTDFDYEIIIADDCSTDGTADIIDEYSKKYPIIKPILRKANIGIINNYLDAMSAAKSQYVAYCECDDYFTDPCKLQKQVDFLEAHPECSMCFHRANVVYESGTERRKVLIRNDRLKKSIFTIEDLLKNNFIPSNSVMYRWRFTEENIYDEFPTCIMPAGYYMHLLHAEEGNIGFINDHMSIYRKHKNGTWYNSNVIFEKHILQYLMFFGNVWTKIANKSYDYCEYACCDSNLNSVLSKFTDKKNFKLVKNFMSVKKNSTIDFQFFMFFLCRYEIMKKNYNLRKDC
jgi:glycosyltransferase involved in cell wall biosynthesis